MFSMQTRDGHRGWYSRGYVPHYDGADLYQVITYRLADGLPAAKLKQIDDQLRKLEPKQMQIERRKRVEKWLDGGHGSCVLRDPGCARAVLDAWRYFDGSRYDLAAWVVMPNHVHVLAYFHEGWPLAKVINSWKSYTAKTINRILREQGISLPPTEGRTVSRLWQRGYWDRYIRNEAHFKAAIQYIENNPVSAGLVSRARDWLFSSARAAGRERRQKWRPLEKSRSASLSPPQANQSI